jgi:hypothetical protein
MINVEKKKMEFIFVLKIDVAVNMAIVVHLPVTVVKVVKVNLVNVLLLPLIQQ